MEFSMKAIFTKMFIILMAIMGLFLTACSDDKNQEQGQNNHIWKHQTDTLQTSKDAAKKLQESLNLQQQKLDENN